MSVRHKIEAMLGVAVFFALGLCVATTALLIAAGLVWSVYLYPIVAIPIVGTLIAAWFAKEFEEQLRHG
jgi:hypothetical protein